MRRCVMVLVLAALASSAAVPATGAAAGPVTESATANITQLDVGHAVACARLGNGTARCWGNDVSGSSGNGAAVGPFARPVTVVDPSGTGPLTGVAEVTTGGHHACARLTNGQVRCWGDNQWNQLGNLGVGVAQALPVTVHGLALLPLAGVTQISAGRNHTCARLTTGQVRCWGDNFEGQLGNGRYSDTDRPVVVSNPEGTGPLTGVLDVRAGRNHTCALLTSGQVRCWGENNAGVLGDGSGSDGSVRPVAVVGVEGEGRLTGVTQISAGSYVSCARDTAGRALCWGANSNGGLGDGTVTSSDVPGVVQNVENDDDLVGVLEVQAGDGITCARLISAQVRCWGQLGDAQVVSQPNRLPVVVRNSIGTGPLGNVAQLAVGRAICARLRNGQARCWGNGDTGLLGNGSSSYQPLPVTVLRR